MNIFTYKSQRLTLEYNSLLKLKSNLQKKEK